METSASPAGTESGHSMNRALSGSPAPLLRRMYATLANVYGPQHWWPAQTPLEVIVGAYLTQNTSWRAVEKSIENLKAHQCSQPERSPRYFRRRVARPDS